MQRACFLGEAYASDSTTVAWCQHQGSLVYWSKKEDSNLVDSDELLGGCAAGARYKSTMVHLSCTI